MDQLVTLHTSVECNGKLHTYIEISYILKCAAVCMRIIMDHHIIDITCLTFSVGDNRTQPPYPVPTSVFLLSLPNVPLPYV